MSVYHNLRAFLTVEVINAEGAVSDTLWQALEDFSPQAAMEAFQRAQNAVEGHTVTNVAREPQAFADDESLAD